MSGVLFVVGNPLLDIATVVDKEYLDRYEIKAGAAYLAEEKHLPIYDEIVKTYKVEYVAGGAAQNSARVAQWLLGPGRKNFTCYTGCIGNDDNGKVLRTATESSGVETHYLVDTAQPTGTCAVLITDKERCLMTNLGAANHYKNSHMVSAEMQAVIERAKFYYATGYFLTVSPESYEQIGKHAAEHNKVVLFNLAAPFIIQFFWEKLALVLPYVDIIFSNEDEAKVLGEKCGWGSDLKVIAQKLSEFQKVNSKRTRTVVFTQGAQPTVVFEDGKITEYPVPPVPAAEIIDTNGAGDSFVGGFLAAYVLGKATLDCVNTGHYAASEIIKRSSCTYPETPAITL
eukprot:TRINITY_DN26362_c0_g1_i1.p1 TRINITY_DN26362_c0_g1~~TRINITY_DN26362_c0_g1_i1.p1  ORF type:complete len:355 (+),score=175.91 TRINITY_DN26362_c0_g1_i1:41-1066(+)